MKWFKLIMDLLKGIYAAIQKFRGKKVIDKSVKEDINDMEEDITKEDEEIKEIIEKQMDEIEKDPKGKDAKDFWNDGDFKKELDK
jgi:acetyl-CoA carboxylase alpha subunit